MTTACVSACVLLYHDCIARKESCRTGDNLAGIPIRPLGKQYNQEQGATQVKHTHWGDSAPLCSKPLQGKTDLSNEKSFPRSSEMRCRYQVPALGLGFSGSTVHKPAQSPVFPCCHSSPPLLSSKHLAPAQHSSQVQTLEQSGLGSRYRRYSNSSSKGGRVPTTRIISLRSSSRRAYLYRPLRFSQFSSLPISGSLLQPHLTPTLILRAPLTIIGLSAICLPAGVRPFTLTYSFLEANF